MDKFWKRRLDDDFVGTRIEGAFNRADREALQNKHSFDHRNMGPAERLNAVMDADIAKKQRDQDIAQIKAYLYEYYGFDGFFNDEMKDAINKFGEKSKKHREAHRVLESALGLNTTRSETDHGGALVSATGGGADFAHNYELHRNANEESLKLAREFLGLEQKPIQGTTLTSGAGLERVDDRIPEAPRSKPQAIAPRSKSSNTNDLENTHVAGILNPFNLKSPDLRQQARILEADPVRARQLIKAAGRDPGLFGL